MFLKISMGIKIFLWFQISALFSSLRLIFSTFLFSSSDWSMSRIKRFFAAIKSLFRSDKFEWEALSDRVCFYLLNYSGHYKYFKCQLHEKSFPGWYITNTPCWSFSSSSFWEHVLRPACLGLQARRSCSLLTLHLNDGQKHILFFYPVIVLSLLLVNVWIKYCTNYWMTCLDKG